MINLGKLGNFSFSNGQLRAKMYQFLNFFRFEDILDKNNGSQLFCVIFYSFFDGLKIEKFSQFLRFTSLLVMTL